MVEDGGACREDAHGIQGETGDLVDVGADGGAVAVLLWGCLVCGYVCKLLLE